MPTATITPPGPILSASVTLTSAQVLAIFTTPVQILPAPGAGLSLAPVAVWANYTYGGTAYSDPGGALSLRFGASGGTGFTLTTSGFWTTTSSRFASFGGPTSANNSLAVGANQPLMITDNTGNPTLGNGTVTVTVAYMVVPVA